AITALIDDRIIGMGGIAFPPHGPAIAFVQLVPPPNGDVAVGESGHAAAEIPEAKGIPEARRYPVAFHRAGLMAMQMIRASGLARGVATAGAGSPAGGRGLKRLGFQPAQGQPIAGKLLFVWNRGSASGASNSPAVRHGRTGRLGPQASRPLSHPSPHAGEGRR